MRERPDPNSQLLERASKGDRRAVGAIFKRYHQRLFRYCAAIVGDPEDARDALQNTMVSVLVALPGERRSIELEPWLYRIAHNESIDVVRRRRHTIELDGEELAGEAAPDAQLETRERMRRLIVDLRELPERQRGALVMRELGGLSFEQIGKAFDTSARVARQTVYEARVSLQDMEGGRAMPCDEVRQKISGGDRRLIRRRDVRAHLRQCDGCQEFQRAIGTRRGDLAAIAPLPALAAGGILQSVLGGAGSGAVGGGGGAAGAGAVGKALGGSMVAKTMATAAVVATIGVAAADRGGLVDVVPGHDSSPPTSTDNNESSAADADLSGGAPDRATSSSANAQATGAAAVAAEGAAVRPAQPHQPSPNAVGETPADTAPAVAQPGNAGGKANGNGPAGEGAGALNAHGANPHANPNASEKGDAGESAPQGNAKGQAAEHGSSAAAKAPLPRSPHAQAEPPANGSGAHESRGEPARGKAGGDAGESEEASD